MFDPETQGLTAADLCARIGAAHALLRETECEELLLAAAWADLHYLDGHGDGHLDDHRPLVERSCAWGGDGCPPVAEHCALELGALRGTGATAARMLIADALDLRHRLPHLWQLVRTGAVRAWHARHVAQATHALSWEACTDVDRALSASLPLLAWPRFRRLLDAAILDADVEARQEREATAAEQRGVWSWTGENGLRTVVAKAASGDAAWFMATVNRIAQILQLDGDRDPVDARRAKAIGLLAQPAVALALLLDHVDDPDRLPDEQARRTADNCAVAPSAASDPDQPEQPDLPDADVTQDVGSGSAAAPGSARRQQSEAVPEAELEAELDSPLEEAAPSGAGRDLGLPRHLLPRDLRAARPRVVLHLHLTDTTLRDGDGLVRPEHGDPLTLEQARLWLADAGCSVTVRPVVDPAVTAPVDAYEIPARTRDAAALRNPVDVFPYALATSRTLDLDHTQPYVPLDRGGPPGQTGLHNLGPLSRTHHRAVTFAGWRRRQPDPGTYLFRSPNGYLYLTTNHGTLTLGRTGFGDALWQAADPCAREPAAAGSTAA